MARSNTKIEDELKLIPGLHLHDGAKPSGSVDALMAMEFVKRGLKNPQPMSPIPPPEWILKNKLNGRPYQKTGVAWMAATLSQHGGCILSDEMGLGKTFQSIQLIRRTMKGTALVLCPGSVRETWRDELLKWGFRPQEIFVVYPGKKNFIGGDANLKVVVCSYHHDMIQWCINNFFTAEYPEFLILDEAHRLRGRDTKRTQVLKEIRPMIPFVIALTGTPQWNTMKDWYALLNLLFPGRFGNQWDFDRRYAGAVEGIHGGLEYPKNEERPTEAQIHRQRESMHTDELQMRLGFYMLGRLKSDVAKDLPPMTVSIRWVDASIEARKATELFHRGKGSIHDAIESTLKGKVEEVLSLAREAQRFVLTTWTNQGAADLHRLLNAEGTHCLLLTASQSGQKRAEIIRDATHRKIGIVATTDLLAEGLNLQHVASVGILHALDHVPHKMAQLFNRLHRIDIVAPVQWHVVAMQNSIDKYIIDAGVFKLESIQAVMGKQKNTEITKAFKLSDKAAESAALAAIYAAMEVHDGVPNEEGEED